ncbi:NgoFVII restriction endonuclease [Brevibacterium casei]|uniref:NgoFVII restriction endonuclease n=1 Tax=Brevibacterium casei TaxID=33889 RepID=A0A449CZJ6_9MICO|nr:restriction endonuclease PLD domain-containing protein [Brevibacterium casei]VEW10781.1 NgoFVII restriction endonuclease [Brevibacterium casei]
MLESANLYSKVIFDPMDSGCDELLVVSGYVSPEMCLRVVAEAEKLKRNIRIRLVVGMVAEDGISKTMHENFKLISTDTRRSDVEIAVSYVRPPLGLHSKVYVWLAKDLPVEAWAGSANFTQSGFGVSSGNQVREEVLTKIEPANGIEYFEAASARSTNISGSEIEQQFGELIRESIGTRVARSRIELPRRNGVVLPLVMQAAGKEGSAGDIHGTSGLNWGMRGKRNRNQAYIPVPKSVRQMGFFPDPGHMFGVSTTDGYEFVMVRAQADGKGLHTPLSNAFLGEYFRKRLGVDSQRKISIDDLLRFGSRFVAFYETDREHGERKFIMEYSPRIESWGVETYKI